MTHGPLTPPDGPRPAPDAPPDVRGVPPEAEPGTDGRAELPSLPDAAPASDEADGLTGASTRGPATVTDGEPLPEHAGAPVPPGDESAEAPVPPGDEHAGAPVPPDDEPANAFVPPDDKPADAPGPSGRAGRNLPAAIAVGVTLALAVVVPLVTVKPLFVAVVAAAIGLGVRELAAALRRSGLEPPEVPLLLGSALMLLLAYVDGAEGLVLGLLVTLVACAAWDAPTGAR